MITEDQLDEAALNLTASIDRLMARDWLPEPGGHLRVVADQVALGHEWEEVRARGEKTPRARCANSGLDYLTYGGREIGTMTGRRPGAKERFRRHLALCRACVMREECLEMAGKLGIWGGKFPHERRTP